VTGAGTAAAIVVDGVDVRLGGADIVRRASITVGHSEWVAIVGPNGAGKSTLLRAIAGLVPASGRIELLGRPVGAMGRRERARTVAVVPQDPVIPPGMTVAEYVLLGRTPHLAALAREGRHDLGITREAMAELDLLPFAGRVLATLSGGERQRAHMARAVAQQAPVLLLDEPTSALDVGHQQDVMDLVDELRLRLGLTVVSTMHDLTLAAQYADRLVLIDRGAVVISGSADEVLTEEHLARFYGARVRIVREGGTLVVVPVRGPQGVPGEPATADAETATAASTTAAPATAAPTIAGPTTPDPTPKEQVP
jgi:iron complex transport system ATP-binding protein